MSDFNKISCYRCGILTDRDELIDIDDNLHCSDCVWHCENCETPQSERYDTYSVADLTYCESCYGRYGDYCDGCNYTYDNRHTNFYMVNDVGSHYCSNCCSDNYNFCDNCDEYYQDVCDNGCDDSDGESRPDIYGIYDYSYKPEPQFYGSSDYHFGIELEMEIRGDVKSASTYINQQAGNFIYLKYDSSIGGSSGYGGFELVTHPATLEYFRDNKSLWVGLDKLRTDMDARSWDAISREGKSTCGLHIHISRSAFKSRSHLHRFMYLMYKNSREFMLLGGRSSHYASFKDVYAYDDYDKPYLSLLNKTELYPRTSSERYSAVNTNNTETIELRFFRGTLLPSGIMSALELSKSAVEYTRDITISDFKYGALSWEWFADYIRVNNGLYPNLYERIGRVNTLTLNSKQPINA